MDKAAKFCCLPWLEHGPFVLLHYYQLSIFQLLHCLSLAAWNLICKLTLNSEIYKPLFPKGWY